MKTFLKLLFVGLFLFPAFAKAQDMADITIEVRPVSENVYMLLGRGGNIGICTGEDGTFMIDDQFAPLSEKIMAAIKTVSEEPVKFLVNTHFHGDHAGGNAKFEEAGALIIAHDNVRKRLAANEKTSGEALPVITFSDDVSFHLNDNEILVTHVHNAHTDGDALVYFMDSNVLHTGDTFFNGRFPYIDLDSGGSVDGDIEAAKKGLMLINDTTKIIPGHGDMGTKADYQKYHDMLVDIRKNVQQAIASGKTEDEVATMEELTKAHYTDKEAAESFITGERIRRTFYKSLRAEKY